MVQGPRFALALLLVAAASIATAATGAPQDGDAYLRTTIGFSAGDVSRLRSGQPVATSPEGREGREIVTFGAVRVDRPPDECRFGGELSHQLEDIDVEPRGDIRKPSNASTRHSLLSSRG